VVVVVVVAGVEAVHEKGRGSVISLHLRLFASSQSLADVTSEKTCHVFHACGMRGGTESNEGSKNQEQTPESLHASCREMDLLNDTHESLTLTMTQPSKVSASTCRCCVSASACLGSMCEYSTARSCKQSHQSNSCICITGQKLAC